MGQGASPEQPAADAGRPPARLRLLAPVALAGQRGVERPGLQVDHVGCGQVGFPTLRSLRDRNADEQSSAKLRKCDESAFLLDYCIRMVVGTVLAQKLGLLF